MPRDTVSVLHSKFTYLLVLMGCLVFVGLGFHREPRVFHARDFKQPYASARCVLHHCDPYSEQDTEAQFVAGHGVDDDPLVFVPYSALYPPPSLLLLTPIAALPYPVALAVWLGLMSILFSIAALMIADLCASYRAMVPVIALAAMVAFSSGLIMLGQVSGVAISLLAIGLWLVLRERPIASAVCLSLAICLKPHDAIFFLPYFLIAGRSWRKSLAWTIGICVVITAASVALFAASPSTAHWLPSLRASLAGNSGPNSVNDPGPGNPSAEAIESLQTIYSVIRNSRPFYSAAAYLTTLVLLVGWLYGVLRTRASEARHLVSIACLASITLMPIYHRQYDTRLMILIFPAIAVLFSMRRYGWAIAATALAVVDFLPQVILLMHRLADSPSLAQNGPVRYLLAFRSTQLGNLGLGILFVAVLIGMARAEGKSALSAES